MATDVLIGQAYFLRFDPTLWQGQRPYAPLGALYAAACVRDGGHTVALFDAMLAESERDWDAALDGEQPAVAVLFEDSFNYLSKMCLSRMREAALTMIAAAVRRGIPVVVAGSDATDHPALYLDAGACVVIAGEGEVTLVQVIDALRRDATPLAQIDGVVVRVDGRLVRTPARPIMRNLDAVPWPAWDLIDVERYRAVWLRRHGHFSMNITTTRGCPYHCNWCAKPIYGQRYTARSPERVAEEVAWLARTFAPDHLWVTDDIFGLKPGWVEAFAAALSSRNAAIPFKCLMRADGISEQSVQALASAGCRTVWIGAESGAQRVLDAMEKGTRVDQIENAARLLRAAGIEVCFFLQFGYPGETFDEIEQTMAMVRRCRPHDIGISVSYPLPGTPFHARVQTQLGAKQNWVDSSDLAMMYRATYTPAFYRTLHAYVHARFRLQRAVGILRDIVTSPHHVSRPALSALAGAVVPLLQLPWLSVRVRRLASEPQDGDAPVLVPLLNRQSAARPSEQGQ